MNLLFCGDANISDGLLITLLSFLDNVDEQLGVYILTASVRSSTRSFTAMEQDYADYLDRLVKEKNSESFVRLFDVTDKFYSCPPEVNIDTRFTPCCMLRLYADMVPELPDRIMYLDNDIICRSDPGEFYYQDIEGVELAGVLDYYGSWFFRNKFYKRDYLNSGVLLLNLARIRETGLFEKCRQRCRYKEMFLPDQSAINKLCTSKKIWSRRYNEQRKLHDNTVFQHFTTSFRLFPWFHSVSVKPWNIEGVHETLGIYQYDDLLGRYLSYKESY